MEKIFLKSVPLKKLELWDKNFRDIKPEAFERLKNKIKELGVFKPLLAINGAGGKYAVIGGNQRLKAYRELGFPAADIILFPELTDPKIITKIAIADNQSDGETDLKKLSELIDELQIPEIELEDFAIEAKSISVNCAVDDFRADSDDDNAPEVDAVTPPKTKLGDVWQLGQHRLLCGSSANKNDFAKLMDGNKARLIFTDPPYNVDYHSPAGISYNSSKFGGDGGKIFNDNLPQKDCVAFYTAALKNLYEHTSDDATIYWWYANNNYHLSHAAFRESDFYISQSIIWLKNSPVFAPGQDYHRVYESCVVGWKNKKAHYRNREISNYQDVVSLGSDDFADVLDVWYAKRDNVAEYVHPTQKPVRLAERALRRNSKSGDNVVDGFGGSGSTLIACEKLGRRCFTMELDPKYCDVIVKRFAAFKGEADKCFLIDEKGLKKGFDETFKER
jgi:DNA modification methylase